MDVTRERHRLTYFLLIAVAFLCRRETEVEIEQLPPTRATLQSIGRRLSGTCSEHELGVIASRTSMLLARLTLEERTALAQGYLRFHAGSPVVVDVAVPERSVPFWIADQNFSATKITLRNCDTTWRVYRKSFSPGWIGLGVNGLDRSPVAHYVVFVRALATGESAANRAIARIDESRSPTWRTILAKPGISAASDAFKPFEALSPELDGAVMIQPTHAARHSTLVAAGRVWKTHVVSGAIPDQVTIAFGGDPARELVWTWRTSVDSPSTAVWVARLPNGVTARPAAGLAATAQGAPGRIIRGESRTVDMPNLLNDPIIRRHRAKVDGLEPDTVYQYALGDGTPRGWGPWQTVKTAPEPGRSTKFLYLGDAQTGLERWGRLLAAAHRRHPDIDFLVLAGDLVDRGNERTNWDHFFLRAAGVFDRVPLMPCVGNHEYLDCGPRLYRAFFALPENGPPGVDSNLVYRFECGDACFVVLDSTMAVCNEAQARRQAAWLDESLRSSTATWKFVLFHHPVYPSHPWRDTPALRAIWVPIFDKHHVDVVLQGHDHAYLRTYPMHAHHRVATPEQGSVYVIAVSGDKFVDQARRDYIAVGLSGVSTYQTIEIDAPSARLTYRAWTEDARMIDEMIIAKSPARVATSRSLATRIAPAGLEPRSPSRSKPAPSR